MTDTPEEPKEGQEGLSFADTLRDCLVCGVVVVDNQRRIASLTTEAAHILGLEPGRHAFPQSLADLPAPLQRVVQECFTASEPTSPRRLELALPRGSVDVTARALPLQAGRSDSGVVLTLNNLTVIRQLEDHIQQLDRLANIGTLAASMAHEIRNALVAGKTFVELLLEKHQDAELVDVVRRELSRIDAIVSRMLNFSGPARRVFEPLSLHETLEHSLRLVEPQREARSIALAQSFGAAADQVNGDPTALQQAFVNLFLNALEAMSPGGTLTVATETVAAGAAPLGLRETAGPPRLRIAIQDTGPGIAPEDLERLFEPFFTTKPTGTGLGLVITRRILEEHHGDISVASQPGKGARFTITLPAVRSH